MQQLDRLLLGPDTGQTQACTEDHLKDTRGCILEYLGGYMVYKFCEDECSLCFSTLERLDTQPDTPDLITVKSRGCLRRPSSQLMKLLLLAESHVRERTDAARRCVYRDIVEAVLLDEGLPSASVGCKNHYVEKTAEVLFMFVRCRLHFFSRERNKKFNEGTRKSAPASGGKKQHVTGL